MWEKIKRALVKDSVTEYFEARAEAPTRCPKCSYPIPPKLMLRSDYGPVLVNHIHICEDCGHEIQFRA